MSVDSSSAVPDVVRRISEDQYSRACTGPGAIRRPETTVESQNKRLPVVRVAGSAHSSRDVAILERLSIAVTRLLEALDNAMDGNLEFAERSVRHLDAILNGLEEETAQEHKGAPSASTIVRGGLAPWQIRRISAFIDANIDTPLHIVNLAKMVRLSSFYFTRAFGESFGCPPHRYIMRRRIERAQGLMLSTAAPLGQIALECGLADQAHFSKVFLKITGESPGSWRRARTMPSACAG